MAYRVIQWATGGIGRAAIEGILSHPELELAVHMGLDLLSRIESVMAELDFLGDAVTATEARHHGLSRYEITTLQLRLPEAPAVEDTPLADAAEPTGSTPW